MSKCGKIVGTNVIFKFYFILTNCEFCSVEILIKKHMKQKNEPNMGDGKHERIACQIVSKV